MNRQSFIHNTKLIALISFMIVSFSNLLAQDEPVFIDTTFLKCEYDTNYYMDTTKMDNGRRMRDEFIFQVGQKVSKFYR